MMEEHILTETLIEINLEILVVCNSFVMTFWELLI